MTGELIPSLFNWLEIDKQKRKAQELDKTYTSIHRALKKVD